MFFDDGDVFFFLKDLVRWVVLRLSATRFTNLHVVSPSNKKHFGEGVLSHMNACQ